MVWPGPVGGGPDELQATVRAVLGAAAFLGLAVVEGWVVQRGRSIVFCDAEVRGAQSDTVAATGSLVYKVSSKPLVMP